MFKRGKKNHVRISTYTSVPKIMIFRCIVGQLTGDGSAEKTHKWTDRNRQIDKVTLEVGASTKNLDWLFLESVLGK